MVLAVGVLAWIVFAAIVGAARAAGSGAFISPAGQGSVIGVTNRISYITAAFDPVDGEEVSWTFNAGTVTGHRTGVICDGAHVSDGGTAPTDGNTSYPGYVPSSGSSHGPVALPNGATACRVYMFHASGYGSNVHNGGLYSFGPDATPTPAPTATPPPAADNTEVVAAVEEVGSMVELSVFSLVLIGSLSLLTLGWIAVAQVKR